MFLGVLTVWITLGMIAGFAMPAIVDNATGIQLMKPQIAFFHVPMAIAMEVGFLMAAWHGIAWLRTREPRRDSLSYAYAEFGFVCGLIATATGAIFAKYNWGRYWSWDPQQIGIVATLLTYAALFALRGAVDDDIKKRNLWAVYAIIGLITAIFSTMVLRRILPPNTSLHPENTLVTSDRLNRIVLWFNVTGYVMLLVYVAQLRARLEIAREKLRNWSWA
jgi:heme exporter protein C